MTHDNLRELSEREQEVRIRGAQEWLVENGFEEGSRFFAYPYGEYDLVLEYHTYAMIGGDPGYWLPKARPTSDAPRNGRSRTCVRTWTLVEFSGIGALFWHGILDETPIAEFDRIMSYVHERREAGELDVITLSELAALQR